MKADLSRESADKKIVTHFHLGLKQKNVSATYQHIVEEWTVTVRVQWGRLVHL